MNNSINYSGFVEMFLNSDDDYEPYGCGETHASTVESQHSRSSNPMLHQDRINEDVWGD